MPSFTEMALGRVEVPRSDASIEAEVESLRRSIPRYTPHRAGLVAMPAVIPAPPTDTTQETPHTPPLPDMPSDDEHSVADALADPRDDDGGDDIEIPVELDGDEPHGALTIPEGYLSDIVLGEDSDTQLDRSAVYDGKTHVSSLIGYCPRRQYLTDKFNICTRSDVGANMRIVWAMGRSVEAHIRKQFLLNNSQSSLGLWECLCGSTVKAGYGEQHETTCPECNSRCVTYGEFTLHDEEYHVIGNPDILIGISGVVFPFEIKSINRAAFEKLDSPLGDHVFQVKCYAHMLRRKGYVVGDVCTVIYANKDFVWGQSPYKEYQVRMPRRMLDVEEAFANAKYLHECVQTDTLPERHSLCADHACPMAKKCSAATHCQNI